MLTVKEIKELFSLLNKRLRERGQRGEVGIVGGAVMCLVFNARAATRDVDGIFEPASLIRELVAAIGEEKGIATDWLNDGAKGFLSPGFDKQNVLELSHLTVWAPEPNYMLAMKCISARWDTSDKDDVTFLIKLLEIKTPKEVFAIIEHYYAKKLIPTKTQFFIEELFEKLSRPRGTTKKS